jgi:cyclohexyl-isocyanide hydratase
VETTDGVSVLPTHTFDDHPPLDVVCVPGGGAEGVVAAMSDPALQGLLKAFAGTDVWVGSVCTGAFIPAAAGLFDGCQATTYRSQLANLRLLREKMRIEVPDDFPRFRLDAKKKRFTGGGVSSSIDLALRLVEVFKDEEAAQTAQLSIQHAPKPPTRPATRRKLHTG